MSRLVGPGQPKVGHMVHELRLFFIALQFLTRVPVPQWVGFEARWLHASARHFPLVGCLVGALAAAIFACASMFWSPWVAAACSIIATVIATGAFHEDGLADTFDALGGAVSRQRALEIMKDSRIGSYGAVALISVLGLKLALLSSLPLTLTPVVLVWCHTGSRACAVTLMRCLPYAGDPEHAKARPLAHQVSTAGAMVAWLWVGLLALALAASGLMSVRLLAVSCLASLVSLVFCARWFQHRLGGITGDTLGATQQLTELSVLMMCAAVL